MIKPLTCHSYLQAQPVQKPAPRASTTLPTQPNPLAFTDALLPAANCTPPASRSASTLLTASLDPYGSSSRPFAPNLTVLPEHLFPSKSKTNHTNPSSLSDDVNPTISQAPPLPPQAGLPIKLSDLAALRTSRQRKLETTSTQPTSNKTPYVDENGKHMWRYESLFGGALKATVQLDMSKIIDMAKPGRPLNVPQLLEALEKHCFHHVALRSETSK